MGHTAPYQEQSAFVLIVVRSSQDDINGKDCIGAGRHVTPLGCILVEYEAACFAREDCACEHRVLVSEVAVLLKDVFLKLAGSSTDNSAFVPRASLIRGRFSDQICSLKVYVCLCLPCMLHHLLSCVCKCRDARLARPTIEHGVACHSCCMADQKLSTLPGGLILDPRILQVRARCW